MAVQCGIFTVHTGEYKTLAAVAGVSERVPECNGTENSLISCPSPTPLFTGCEYLLVDCRGSTPTTPTVTPSVPTATEAPTVTPSVTPSVPEAPTVTPSVPTATEAESSSSVPVGVIAGMGTMGAIIIAITVVVILLILVKYRHKKTEEGLHLEVNMAYGTHPYKPPTNHQRYTYTIVCGCSEL